MSNLPGDWALKPLSEVCQTVSKMDPIATGRSSVRYVDIGSVDGATHRLNQVAAVDSATAPSRCRQAVRSGDTIFSTVRPYLEKIAYIESSLDNEFASTGFCVLRPTPALEPRFLFHFASSSGLLDQVLPMQKGVSYPAVLDREVRACAIPVPPIAEQRRVVEILEEHLANIDSAMAAVTAAMTSAESLRVGMLAALLDGATMDPAGVMRTIGELAIVGTGTTPSRSNKAFFDGGEIPWITSGDLDQRLIEIPSQYVTERALEETSLRLYPPGTLLVAMYGEGKTRGTVAELGIHATVNQACAAIQLKSDDLRGWTRLALEANYDRMRGMAAGGVQPNLNLSLVRAIEIPVPSEETRCRLVDSRDSLEEGRGRLKAVLELTSDRSTRLRRGLLAAAFSGKLTARSSDIFSVEDLIAEESA